MNTALDIIVIILSSFLAVFLILGIIVLVEAIKIVHSIKRVVEKGEQVIDSAEAAADMFKKAGGPLGIVRSLTNIVETISKHKHKQGKE